MISFSLFNIPIRVLPWFWVTMVLIGASSGADSKQALFNILLFMIAGFISVLIHELGHALTAKHFGKRPEIVLQAFGGYAAYSGAPLSRPKSFMVSAAGPAIQILLGVIAFAIYKQADGISSQAKYFLWVLALISLFWAIFNLLPVIPMDGGRMLETALGPQRQRLTLKISMGVAIAIALLSVVIFPGSILIPLFMGFMAYESYKALQQNSWR